MSDVPATATPNALNPDGSGGPPASRRDADQVATTNGPGAAENLAWLTDDLADRVASIQHAIVFSNDGLVIAHSRKLDRDGSEYLAAVASGLGSLARGAGRHFGNGEVLRTVVELKGGYLFVTSAGNGASLAVLCGSGTDVGLVAYEMEMLVVRVGQYLTAPARAVAAA